MARSHAIWIVMWKGVPLEPYGAFTVKHEMITHIERRPSLFERVYVLKYSDGDCNPPELFTLHELGITE